MAIVVSSKVGYPCEVLVEFDPDSSNLLETNPELGKFILSKLTEALLDNDPEVRRIAALNMGRVGDEGFRAVPELSKMLYDDPVPELRQLAASVLAGLQPRTLPILVQALANENPETFRAARKALQGQGLEPHWIMPLLHAVSFDADPAYRLQAINALFYVLDGRIAYDDVEYSENDAAFALERFKGAMSDSDEFVRLVAAYALWIVYRDTSGVELVKETSKNQNSKRQELASIMLNAIHRGMENE